MFCQESEGVFLEGILCGMKGSCDRNRKEFGQELLGILLFFICSSVRNQKNMSVIRGSFVRGLSVRVGGTVV